MKCRVNEKTRCGGSGSGLKIRDPSASCYCVSLSTIDPLLPHMATGDTGYQRLHRIKVRRIVMRGTMLVMVRLSISVADECTARWGNKKPYAHRNRERPA